MKKREIYYPTKDMCGESHLIYSRKFELVLQTIEMDPFKTSKFGWTDYKNNMLLNIQEENLKGILWTDFVCVWQRVEDAENSE